MIDLISDWAYRPVENLPRPLFFKEGSRLSLKKGGREGFAVIPFGSILRPLICASELLGGCGSGFPAENFKSIFS